MISRIGHSRGRPVAQGFGKCGAITSHSASVRSVWYRVTVRLSDHACRSMGVSLLHTGDIEEARVHIDRAIALYDPAKHRPLATRFGQDVRV